MVTLRDTTSIYPTSRTDGGKPDVLIVGVAEVPKRGSGRGLGSSPLSLRICHGEEEMMPLKSEVHLDFRNPTVYFIGSLP